MKEKIHIYHTNDIHSHFENWPRIQAFIEERKAYHNEKNEDVFIFDIGDFADRWHPFTEGTLGKGNTAILNDANYTAITIGNNEGITFSHEALDHLYLQADFDVILANLYLPGHKRPNWLVPYKIYETEKGTKIGVTAVTTYYQKLYELLGWEISEPFTELELQLNQLKDEADFIIVLSHLGIHDDEKMCSLFPQIDLILGAHTHHYFPKGQWIGDVAMAAAGKYGYYTGYVQVETDTDSQVAISEITLYETSNLVPVKGEDDITHQLAEVGKSELDITVASIPERFTYSWEHPSVLAELLCEAIDEWCKPDCSMINSGLVLTELEKGKVTKFDLHQMLPHPINPCVVELTGAELKEIYLHSLKDEWVDLPVIGLGFRGSVMGCFVYKGIDFDEQEQRLWIRGKRLDPTRTYKLATVDMLTFGRFFPEIQRSPVKNYYMPELLREIMAWKLQKVSSSTGN